MLRKALILLAGIGLADSLYLTWIKISANGVCIVGGGCETVNTSPYSEISGIPIALLGAGAYLAILLILFLEPRSEFLKINAPMFVFGLTLAGVLYSAYLTYLELFVIYAVCVFCVGSAIVLVLMLIFSSLRVRASLKEV